MLRFVFGLLVALGISGEAEACSANPSTLQNGTVADATQVMALFNNLLNCINAGIPGTTGSTTLGSGLTMPSPTMTGIMTTPDGAAWSSGGIVPGTSAGSSQITLSSGSALTAQPLLDLHDLSQTAGGGWAMRWFGMDSNGTQQQGAVINGGLSVNTAGAYKGDIDLVAYGPTSTVLACAGLSGLYAGFIPCTDNVYEVGDSTLRWQKGWYSQNLTVGGTASPNTLTVSSATGGTFTNASNGALELVPQTSTYEAVKWYGSKTFAITNDTNMAHVGNGSSGSVLMTIDTSGNTALNGGYFAPTTTAVGSLPACGAGLVGAIFVVTDATAPTYNATAVGGGAVKVPVVCNGTNWTAH